MQFITQNSKNKIIALAALFEIGNQNNELLTQMGFGLENPLFGSKLRNNESVSINHNLINVKVDIGKYMNNKKNFVSYIGSLTSPPCNSDVKWFVLLDKLQASKFQINSFPILFGRKTNIRGLQPNFGRQLLSN